MTDPLPELADAPVCPDCDGRGIVYVAQDFFGNWHDVDCWHCHGTGALLTHEQYLRLAGVQS